MAEADDSIGKLLALIDETCTAEMVREILRKAKDNDKTILVSGSKETVISSNLRVAIERKAIPKDAVYHLLCGAEENGRQHIFYYRPRTEDARVKYSNAEEVAEKLFGTGNWKTERKFPQFHLEPVGVEWSDFRIERKTEQAMTWTAKLYSGVYRQVFLREERQGEKVVAFLYEEQLSREVYVVRYHSTGLLEIRVPRDSARAQVLEFVSQAWEVIGPAVDLNDFEPWDLHKVCMSLINNAEEDKRYTLGNARMIDEETGSAEFKPPHGEADLDSSPSRRSAVRMYNECRELGVHWLSKGEEGPRAKLKTIIGKLKMHEMLVAGKATAEAVDYVTYRLLEAHEKATAAS